jgi:transcriptional regulator with XRE-family HTH domain
MPKNPTPAPPGQQPTKLKARRLVLGLLQKDVARASKGRLTRDRLSRIETGEAWPNPLQLQALADVYACPLTTVCEESVQAWLGRHKAPSHG